MDAAAELINKGLSADNDSCSSLLDKMEQVPTSFEVLKILLNAEMVAINEGDQADVQGKINEIPQAVVGLEFVAEYQDPRRCFEPGYLCTLCESRYVSKQLLSHLISTQHRMKYMEVNYNAQFTVLSFKALSEERRQELLNKYTREIEEKEGRGTINLRIVLPEPVCKEVFALHMQLRPSSCGIDIIIEKEVLSTRDKDKEKRTRSRRSRSRSSRSRSRAKARHRSRSPRSPRHSHRSSAHSKRRSPERSHARRRRSSEKDDVRPAAVDGVQIARSEYPSDLQASLKDDYYELLSSAMLNQSQAQAAQFHERPSAETPMEDFRDIDFRPLIPMPTLTASLAASGSELKFEKPNFVYSEKEERLRRIAQIERTLPLGCESNVERGWFSVRQMSVDYYKKLAAVGCDAHAKEYFPYRCLASRSLFYGENWNPSILRRLQDKFNFKLNHIAWLQKLITDYSVPVDRPLDMKDLEVLESEVERAVLNDLLNVQLKLTHEESMHNPELVEYVPDASEGRAAFRKTEPEIFEYNAALTAAAVKEREKQQNKSDYLLQPNYRVSTASLQPDTKSNDSTGKVTVTSTLTISSTANRSISREFKNSTEEDKVGKSSNAVPLAAKKQSDLQPHETKDLAIMALIEQILQTARSTPVKNAVLELLLSFPNAKQLLFQLATKQPATLQQLVSIIKNPSLSVPPPLLTQLQDKLRAFASQIGDDGADGSETADVDVISKSAGNAGSAQDDQYDPAKPLVTSDANAAGTAKARAAGGGKAAESKAPVVEDAKKKKKMLEIMERVEQFRLKTKQKEQSVASELSRSSHSTGDSSATVATPGITTAMPSSALQYPLSSLATGLPLMPPPGMMFPSPLRPALPSFVPPPMPAPVAMMSMLQQMMQMGAMMGSMMQNPPPRLGAASNALNATVAQLRGPGFPPGPRGPNFS